MQVHLNLFVCTQPKNQRCFQTRLHCVSIMADEDLLVDRKKIQKHWQIYVVHVRIFIASFYVHDERLLFLFQHANLQPEDSFPTYDEKTTLSYCIYEFKTYAFLSILYCWSFCAPFQLTCYTSSNQKSVQHASTKVYIVFQVALLLRCTAIKELNFVSYCHKYLANAMQSQVSRSI